MSLFKPSIAKLYLFLVILLNNTFASAATQYISDEFRVPLRNSPCNKCKIVHRGLKTGLSLTVLEVQDEWTQVRTPSGLEGWMPNQYLSKTPIARDRIEKYRTQADSLAAENRELKKKLNEITNNNNQLTNQLNDLDKNNTAITEELSNIRTISADAVNLHEQNRELLKLNKELQTDLNVVTATKEQLEKNQLQRWFVYGGLLVFLSTILSAVLPHLKPKKKGYSEWR